MSMYQRGLAQALDRWHGRRVLLGHAKDAVMRDEEIGMLPRTVQLGYGVRHVGLGENVTFWSIFLVSQRATPA